MKRFVLICAALMLAGCSQINTPAQVSTQIDAEQLSLEVAIQGTIAAAKAGLLKGTALQSAYNYESVAATAIAAADTAYQAGDTSTAGTDLTQATSALASAAALVPATTAKP